MIAMLLINRVKPKHDY